MAHPHNTGLAPPVWCPAGIGTFTPGTLPPFPIPTKQPKRCRSKEAVSPRISWHKLKSGMCQDRMSGGADRAVSGGYASVQPIQGLALCRRSQTK